MEEEILNYEELIDIKNTMIENGFPEDMVRSLIVKTMKSYSAGMISENERLEILDEDFFKFIREEKNMWF